jgi:hypothetical protein
MNKSICGGQWLEQVDGLHKPGISFSPSEVYACLPAESLNDMFHESAKEQHNQAHAP